MSPNEQQVVLALLHATRAKVFIREGSVTGPGRWHNKCKLCDNMWPAGRRADIDYHSASCPVPRAEAYLIWENISQEEVYYGLEYTAAPPKVGEKQVVGADLNNAFHKGDKDEPAGRP